MTQLNKAVFESSFGDGISLVVVGEKNDKGARKAVLNTGNGRPEQEGWLKLVEAGENKWYEFIAPLIDTDKEQGELVMQSAMNENGQFVDGQGDVVEYSGEAKKEYVFTRNADGKLFYGVYATLSPCNNKASGELANDTFLKVKVYSPFEARDIARIKYSALERKKRKDAPQLIENAYKKEKTLRKEKGKFVTLFLNDNYPGTRDMLRQDGFQLLNEVEYSGEQLGQGR